MKPTKPYNRMNVEELRAATRQFDREFVIDQARPLTPSERAKWNRMKRQPGRPRVGQGVEVVSLSIERTLLKQADRLAKKRKISRARLIAEGLESLLNTPKSRPAAKPKRKAA